MLDHDTVVPVNDGGARARAARWKISMMTMRPPQQGHGGRRSGGDAASSTSTWRRRSEQLPGTRDIVFAAGTGEQAVVTDAVEARGKRGAGSGG